jgi:beta-glucosidase
MSVPIEKKIALTGGLNFWQANAVEEAGLPSVMLTDGPHGVRKQRGGSDHVGINDSEPATCFPPAVGLSSTWSREVVGEVGRTLGVESRELGVAVLLGPGANIKRNPLCGRNFEYFSEDPFLTGELAAAYVNGVQSQGVGTSLKHYAANNQETDRMRRDSQVDERTLREVYLRGFGKVVKQAQPWTVMCSYNRVNGTFASENHFLLTEVLRDEWGFEGFVVSDWGAVWNRVNALKAGLDLQMPADGGDGEKAVTSALAAGEIDEATIDQAYERVLRVLKRGAESVATATGEFDADAHHRIARTAAEQAVVLLSNDGVLPLAGSTTVAVIGEFARTPRYQGAGSSRVNPTRLDNALDAIRELADGDVVFAPGFTTAQGQELGDDPIGEAVAAARGADVVLMFMGLGESHESEGYDRTTCDIPAEQMAVLDAVLAVNPNVVVVLSNGSTVLVPFASRVRAVVEGWLLGQAGGPALADVLYGVVNPSGKITETIPHRIQDVPSYPYFPGDPSGVVYGEGLFVGYRGYDAREMDVAYPFGHGLSYTTFAYSDLAVATTESGIDVSVTVANTGDRAGREVVQVYVAKDGSGVVRVPRELKGFADVTLEPGRSERLTIAIARDELTYWSTIDQAWLVEPGAYTVQVGASSRDLRLTGSVDLDGDRPVRRLTLSSTVGEVMSNPAAGATVMGALGQLFGGGTGEMDPEMARMVMDIPLVAVAGFSGLGTEKMQQVIDEANAAARV